MFSRPSGAFSCTPAGTFDGPVACETPWPRSFSFSGFVDGADIVTDLKFLVKYAPYLVVVVVVVVICFGWDVMTLFNKQNSSHLIYYSCGLVKLL